ncbi:MAG: hypothetical protein NTX87_17305 [Planctomycetota bacterium]|nr:hypothetical protein [Planctomycetota bacterium]
MKFSGMNGENASSEIVTGRPGSRYSTYPMGYSPLNAMSGKPVRSSARTCILPPARMRIAKPWSSGDAGSIGLA